MIKVMKSPGAVGLYISQLGAAIWINRHWAVIWRNKPVPRFGKIRQVGPLAIWVGYDPNSPFPGTRIQA